MKKATVTDINEYRKRKEIEERELHDQIRELMSVLIIDDVNDAPSITTKDDTEHDD